MPGEGVIAPITGPWAFVGGFVGSLLERRRRPADARTPSLNPAVPFTPPLIELPPVFRVPEQPGPQIPTLPTVVVTAPRPPISQTGSIGRYFDRVKKKFRKLSKEERDMLEFVGEYYANNYMPMPGGGGIKRGNIKLPRNDARAGKSKQRGFVVPGPQVMPDIEPILKPMRKPVRTPRAPTQPMPRQPLPVFRPSDLPPLPGDLSPQRSPQPAPQRRTDTQPLPKTAPGGWEGDEVFLPMPRRVPQTAPKPKPATKTAPKTPKPAKTPTKLPSWALPFALQVLPGAVFGRSAQAIRATARVPGLKRVPELQPPAFEMQRMFQPANTTRTKTDECECPKPERKPRKPRTVCYEGTYTERSFGINKRKRKQVPCQ